MSGIISPLEDAEEGVSGVEEYVSGFGWREMRKRVLHRLELDAVLQRVFTSSQVQQTSIQSTGSWKSRNYAKNRQEEGSTHLSIKPLAKIIITITIINIIIIISKFVQDIH